MSERSPLLMSSDESTTQVHQRCATSEDETPGASLSIFRGAVIGIAVLVLIFILTFGVSVLTTIQSVIARDLHVTHGVSWFLASYMIANTSITPIAGRICDVFTPRFYLLGSTAIQIIGLLITAFAQSLSTFLVGRAVSGAGAAAITPVAFILVTELADRRRWGLLFGIINCGYTLGVAMGAIVGGELQPRIGWRAVFWIQAPVCFVAALVAFLAIPSASPRTTESEEPKLKVSQMLAKIDYFGLITLITSVVLLLFSLASPTLELTPLVLSMAMLIVFGFVESQWAVEPIIPPVLLRSRGVILTGVATIGFMSARWEVLFYMPTYGIAVRGWTQMHSGLLLIPTNFGFGLGSVVVGILHIKRAGSYYMWCLICFLLFIVEHFLLSRLITLHSEVWVLITALFANGFISGAILSYNLPHLLHLTRPMHHVIVIPLNAMFRGLSGSIGSSLAGGLFSRSLQDSLCKGFERRGLYGRGELIMQLLSRPMLVQQLEGSEREVAVESYASSIQYLFVVGCFWTLAMLIVQAGTGWTAPDQEKNERKPQDATLNESAQR